MRKFLSLICVFSLVNGFILPTAFAQVDDFNQPRAKGACLLDPEGEACKKDKEALLKIQGKNLAIEETGKLSCSYDQGVTADATLMSLMSGQQRMSIIADAVPQMQNPNQAKPVMNPADSQSVGMIVASEALSIASLSANELAYIGTQTTLSQKCNLDPTGIGDSVRGQVQLVSIACIIQELVTKMSSLFNDSDTLSQQVIEMEAAMNQALAEDVKRDKKIADEKQKMKQINQELTKALKDLKVAKAAQVKATANLAKANEALSAANAIKCTPPAEGEADDGCEKAKADAVKAAQAAVDAAKVALDKAVKALEKAVKTVADILINKMGAETSTVLSMLAGTVQGDVDGQNVHFEVNGEDYTLINVQPILDNYTGADPHRDLKTDLGSKYEDTTDYFQSMINTYGDEHNATGNPRSSDSANVLDVFSKVGENGIDNLETIASAVLDYTKDASENKIDALQAMKTPNTRYIELTKQLDKRRQLQETIKPMLEKLICYLDLNLKLFKDIYKSTIVESVVPTPLFLFLNTFTTADYVKKVKEGYISKVNIEKIRVQVACLADNGTTSACQIKADAVPEPTNGNKGASSGKCYYNSTGPVIGPSTGPESSCTKDLIGKIINQDGSDWVCTCN